MAINEAIKSVADTITSQLHEFLTNKKPISFWKTWKSKVCKQSENRKIRIENDYSDKEAADKFAEFFKSACTPNTSQFDIEKRKIL